MASRARSRPGLTHEDRTELDEFVASRFGLTVQWGFTGRGEAFATLFLDWPGVGDDVPPLTITREEDGVRVTTDAGDVVVRAARMRELVAGLCPRLPGAPRPALRRVETRPVMERGEAMSPP
ncbi:hypothetical protein ACE7GA_14050 [Roseomonas sp. CCTCC AB2023176]|uniref:hypothetical protein n=1 Tax=Roseomonas sp. CCTCC AB2023176 TaxID=3342640 RepID=UPI0035E39E04